MHIIGINMHEPQNNKGVKLSAKKFIKLGPKKG